MRRSRVIPLAVTFAVVFVGLANSTAEAQYQRKIYSVKFLCGEYDGPEVTGREGPAKPGNYQTAINIYNPTVRQVPVYKRAVLLFDSENPPTGFETPVPAGSVELLAVPSRWGVEIDCPDIRSVLLNNPAPTPPFPFIKGYVVLVTFLDRHDLNVVAAYTSHGFLQVPDNSACVGVDDPFPCCTGADSGTCVVNGPEEGFSSDVERIEPILIP